MGRKNRYKKIVLEASEGVEYILKKGDEGELIIKSVRKDDCSMIEDYPEPDLVYDFDESEEDDFSMIGDYPEPNLFYDFDESEV